MRTLLELTTKIVSAHVANNRIASDDVPNFLISIHATLSNLYDAEVRLPSGTVDNSAETGRLATTRRTRSRQSPADVPSAGEASDPATDGTAPAKPLIQAIAIEDSVRPDRIICLEDGAEVVLLKRHLRKHFQMTPDQYRRRWNLPSDYPMAAPNYVERKRATALASGFGTTVRPGRQKRPRPAKIATMV